MQERIAILRQIADGLVIADRDECITYMNEAGRRLLGLDLSGETIESVAEIIDARISDGRPCRSDDLALVRAVRYGETTTSFARRLRRADGSEVVIQGSAVPVMAGDGTRYGTVFTFHDVTEQRRTEDALRERDKRLQTIFLEAPIQIALADLHGRFLATNPAMHGPSAFSSAKDPTP